MKITCSNFKMQFILIRYYCKEKFKRKPLLEICPELSIGRYRTTFYRLMYFIGEIMTSVGNSNNLILW
jgi:hypothetical protein